MDRGDVTRDGRWSPVLALTVLDASTLEGGGVGPRTRLLLAVRDPATHPTHPDTVSVPTQRIPRVLHEAIAGRPDPGEAGLDFFGDDLAGLAWTEDGPAAYAARALLASKIGLAEALERRAVRFEAAPAARQRGRVEYATDPGAWFEEISMLNVAVRVEAGADLFPPATASYARILWAEAEAFRRSVAEKNPALLSSALDPFRYCIHGLCIASSFGVVGRLGRGA